VQAPARYENSVGAQILQAVSFFWEHGVAISDPSMQMLHGTQVKDPDDWTVYSPVVAVR
jgi:hypothetical protein